MAPGPAPLTPLDVLVVEDEHIHQQIARRLVEAAGHRVHPAATGLELLDRLSHGRYDLILLDIEMPELDGLTALRRAVERHGDALPPTAVVTASDLAEVADSARAAGALMVLPKPLSREKLAHVIESFGLHRRL